MPFSFADKREHLVRPWSLALMVAAVLVVLILLMPRSSFLTHPELIRERNPLSTAYLQALVKANPDDDEIRLLFAEHLAATGRIAEAKRQMERIRREHLRHPEQLAFLAMSLAVQQWASQAPGASERERAMLESILTKGFALPPDKISLAQWKRLAMQLLHAGLPAWAARAYLRIAELEPSKRLRWLREAAKWYLAAERPDRAGMLQLRIARQSRSLRDAQQALDHLIAAEKLDQALDTLPEFLSLHPEDRDLRRKALRIAQTSNRLDLAALWIEQWLAAHTNDLELIRQAIEIHLSAGNPEKALRWARHWVELEPASIAAHERLARIADWSGQPALALRHWQWLAEHRGSPDDLRRAIAIAHQLLDYRTAEHLLDELGRKTGLSPSEASLYAWLQEKLGNPRSSEEARIAYLLRRPNDRRAWEELAMLREFQGKLKEAEATWQSIEQRFGMDEHTTIHRARLLDQLGQPRRAFALLEAFARRHPPQTAEFWKDYGALAWELEHSPQAYAAYRWLWDHGQAASFESQRLMMLLRDQGDAATMLRISREAWRRFHDPEVLLLAAESAMMLNQWEEADQWMELADRLGDSLAFLPRYWLIHAQWLRHHGHNEQAMRNYRRALALSPGDSEARTGLLWLLIETHRYRTLRRHLAAWQQDAWFEPSYWPAYAAGLRELGLNRAALPWFRKTVERHPGNLLWQLEYADALQAAGNASGAWRLRRYLFRHQWPAIHKHPDNAGALAHLLKKMQGRPAAEHWIHVLLRHQNDPVLQRLATTWALEHDQHDQALYWLMRQHAHRIELPAWQQLALAMSENDMPGITRALQTQGGVAPISRALATKQMVQLDRAWQLALADSLGTGRLPAHTQSSLLRTAREIHAQVTNAVHLEMGWQHFGPLNIQHEEFHGFRSRNNFTWEFEIRQNRLRPAPLLIPSPAGIDEMQWKLVGKSQRRQQDYELYLGQVRQSGGASSRAMQWGGHWQWRSWNGSRIGLGIDMHATGMETAAFRIAGLQDRVTLETTSDLTNREFVALRGDLHRYRTRWGEPLGQGFGLETTLGHRLQLTNSLAEEQIQLRLTSQWKRNRLEPLVPAGIRVMLPNIPVDAIVPSRFASIGMGLNIQRDRPANDEAVARTPIYRLDLWTGWQWPDNAPVFSLEAGLGLPVFGHDALSIEGFAANTVRGGLQRQSVYGFRIIYSYNFGR